MGRGVVHLRGRTSTRGALKLGVSGVRGSCCDGGVVLLCLSRRLVCGLVSVLKGWG